MNGAGIADRLAIIAHGVSSALLLLLGNGLLTMKPLVSYYEKLGFVSKGPSEAQFGGGGWFDMVSCLPSTPICSQVTLTPDRYSTSNLSRLEPCTDDSDEIQRAQEGQRRIIWNEFSSSQTQGGRRCIVCICWRKYHSAIPAIPTILVCKHTVSAPPPRSRPARPPPPGT